MFGVVTTAAHFLLRRMFSRTLLQRRLCPREGWGERGRFTAHSILPFQSHNQQEKRQIFLQIISGF